MPRSSAVGCSEEGGVFNSSVNRVRVCWGRFQMPHPFEFPGVLCAVEPLVGGEGFAGSGGGVVDELVAFRDRHSSFVLRWFTRFQTRLEPRLTPIIRALNDLAEEAAALGHVDAAGVGG